MKEYRRRLEGLLQASGVEFEVVHGGKHTLVRFIGRDGRRRQTTLDVTTSDNRRAWRNARAQMRRMLRDAGYEITTSRRNEGAK